MSGRLGLALVCTLVALVVIMAALVVGGVAALWLATLFGSLV